MSFGWSGDGLWMVLGWVGGHLGINWGSCRFDLGYLGFLHAQSKKSSHLVLYETLWLYVTNFIIFIKHSKINFLLANKRD